MFITHKTHRSPISSILKKFGEEHWIATEIAIDKCWFVLTVLMKDQADDHLVKISKTLLMGAVEHVEQAIEQSHDDGFEISTVNVVTPSYQNGTLRWSMEPLAKVWASNKSSVAILETVSGKRINDSIAAFDQEDLAIGPLRFEIPMHKQPTH